jgi:hypothetical protein
MKIEGPDPHPDPLVRGMDPRIRIHTKISWIRDTGQEDTELVAVPNSVADPNPDPSNLYVFGPPGPQ